MKIKISLGLILAIFISISATSFSENKGASMLQGKPFFSIKVDISGCRYEVRINDIPVIENSDGLPITTSFPVNEYITNGNNELSIFLMPLFDDAEYPYNETKGSISAACEAIASLEIKQSGTPNNEKKIISSLTFNGSATHKDLAIQDSFENKTIESNTFSVSETGDISITKPSIEYWDTYKNQKTAFTPPKYFNFEQKNRISIEKGVKINQIINLNTSLPDWKWVSSKIIHNNEETKQSLYNEYLKIQHLILSNEVSKEKLYPLFSERTSELAQAYYISESEMFPSDIIECATNSDKYELLEMNNSYNLEENVFLNTYGNGKLASLTIWNNSPRITFNETSEHGGATDFPIMFRKENGKWIITR